MALDEKRNVRAVSASRLRTMLYSLYQKCCQSSRTVTEYAEEFMRLASLNQLRESDAQQVARFNNGLRYDIQAIASHQTTWTIDEAIHIALKAEQTIKKQKIGSSMYKTKLIQTKVVVANQERVNLTEGDKAHSESEDEGLIISPNAVFEDDSEAFLGLVRRLVLTGKENTYTFSKGGHKFTLCPYLDEVQATTTKEKKNQIMLCSTRNKEKNICATTIHTDQVLKTIKNSWSSSFQEGENDGGPKLKKGVKDNPDRSK
ncbi:hypothetical protein Tco_0409284 [Tanacetum coccineum]